MDRRTFDSLFTTDRLQMLKVLLPCLPPASQGGLAVYIKMQELQYTLNFLKHHSNDVPLLPMPEGTSLFDQLLPYCSPAQKEQLTQIQEMTQQMETIRDTLEMAQMMQEMFPEGTGEAAPDLSQILNLFSAAEKDPAKEENQ